MEAHTSDREISSPTPLKPPVGRGFFFRFSTSRRIAPNAWLYLTAVPTVTVARYTRPGAANPISERRGHSQYPLIWQRQVLTLKSLLIRLRSMILE